MTNTPTKRQSELNDLTDRFVDAFNRQNIEDVMAFFAETAQYNDAYGDTHTGLIEIRSAFEPVLNGKIGKILFKADDRFIDAEAGKVMDSWTLKMFCGEGVDKERSLIGLDLLHFEGDKLVRKITYKRG